MLQKIRDNTQGLIAKIFVGFLVLIFALFGVETLVGTYLNQTAELEVNGESITTSEIESLVQNKLQEYYRSLGDDANYESIDTQRFRVDAVNELIQRELLRQLAENNGIDVAGVTIDRIIMQTPDFQVEGKYNDERATLLLTSSGLTPQGYRSNLREQLRLNQVVSAFNSSAFVTEAEVEKLGAIVNEKRDIRLLGLALDPTTVDTQVTDEEIDSYYVANTESFLIPEAVKISWLSLDKNRLFEEVSIADDTVKAAYEQEVAAFNAQTERRAAHILLGATNEEEYTAAEDKALELKARLDAGEDFTELALEFSQDEGSAQVGGDLGYTRGDSFVEEFEAALAGLEIDEVSNPVRTEFGFHLIKLLDIEATTPPNYEERYEALARELKDQEVNRLFVEKSEEMGNLAFESVDLEDPASILGLEPQTSEFFSRTGGEGIAALSSVINASFSEDVLEEGLNSDLINLDENTAIVLRVVDHRVQSLDPLDNVRDGILESILTQRMEEQTRLTGDSIVASLESGQNVDSLLTTLGLSWESFDGVKRDSNDVPPVVIEQVFSMAAPEEGSVSVRGFKLPGGEYAVAQVFRVMPGSKEEMPPEEISAMRKFLQQQAASADFASFYLTLEDNAEITGRSSALESSQTF